MDSITLTKDQLIRVVDIALREVFRVNDDAPYITMEEVMRRLNCHRSTVWRYRKEGRLTEYSATGEMLFSANQVRLLKKDIESPGEEAPDGE